MKKRVIILIVILSLVIVPTIVYAYYKSIQVVHNEFKVSDIDVRIEENFDSTTWPDETKKEVFLVNYSTSPAVLRVMYTEIWEYDNNIISNTINNNNVVIKNWTNLFNEDFIYKDGWYYYKHLVNANESIKILDKIKLNRELVDGKDEYIEGKYELTFYYEALQPTKKAIKDLWDIDVTINENIINWNF